MANVVEPVQRAWRWWWAPVWLTLALSACTSDVEGGHLLSDFEDGAASDCSAPAIGCACEPHSLPIACNPPPPVGSDLCLEGTRYCEGGYWSECRDVRMFEKPAASTVALIDPTATHPQCSDCEANCYRVVDTLDPSAGPLTGPLFNGVSYDMSGGGITLTSGAPAPPAPMGPPGSLFIAIDSSGKGSVNYTTAYHPQDVDVYFMLDTSLSMATSVQQFAFQFDANGNLVDPNATCADGATSPQGIGAALNCLSGAPEVGIGFFRDLPFDPYATDTSLPTMAAALQDAMLEIAYRDVQGLDADQTLSVTALGNLGGFESSGNPDAATSITQALHSVATGQGMWFGHDRPEVAAGSSCGSGRFGYPCFRSAASDIVVAVTNAPFHNGPLITSGSVPDPDYYDYGYMEASPPPSLAITNGTTTTTTAVPATNDDGASAFDLTASSGDAATMLETFTGSTASLTAQVSEVNFRTMCLADDLSHDAVFSFYVGGAAGGSTPIFLSTQGSRFDTSLAVYDGLPGGSAATQITSMNMNETFGTAEMVPDVLSSYLTVSGSTGSLKADYQGSVLTDSCGAVTANSLAPEAFYAFSVSSASATPVDVDIEAEMGSSHAVLAIYDSLPTGTEWPYAAGTSTAVSGNDDTASVYVLPDPVGDYYSVTGDTSTLTARYDASVLGNSECTQDSTSPDAIFRLDVVGTHTVRIDTEGSEFDTVISLHDLAPITNTAGSPIVSTDMNGTPATADSLPALNGRDLVVTGDTSAIGAAAVDDRVGCGVGASCSDAFYKLRVDKASTFRLQAEGTGFEPVAVITRQEPSYVQGLFSPVATGANHTCTISEGLAYCWGADTRGQLGDGTATTGGSAAAVEVSGISNVVQVAAYGDTTCAVIDDGRVYCWGASDDYKLGQAVPADSDVPVEITDVGPDVGDVGKAVQVEVGGSFVCALLTTGEIACWGDNANGQLGSASPATSYNAVVQGGSNRYLTLASGDNHGCAIELGGSIWCWGEGQNGKLGDGATSDNTTPNRVSNYPVSPNTAAYVMAGTEHSCAVLSSGEVICWGLEANGRLGNNSTGGTRTTPVKVLNFDIDADGSVNDGNLRGITGGFAAGLAHTCVTANSGFVMCWGENGLGQLGDSTTTDRRRPVLNQGVFDALAVSTSRDHTCALRDSGAIVCWGDGNSGKVGDGNTGSHNVTVPVQAQAGTGFPVSFGSGYVTSAVTRACRSTALPPEPGCTRDYYSGTGTDHAYFFCNTPRKWGDAAAACQAVGMELAHIDQMDENAFVASRISSDTWLGFRRTVDDSNYTITENMQFDDIGSDLGWQATGETCIDPGWFWCNESAVTGNFTGPMSGMSDANNAVWATNSDYPSDSWGHNCVKMSASDGKWRTENCGGIVADPASGGSCSLGWIPFIGGIICGFIDFWNNLLSTWSGWFGGGAVTQVVDVVNAALTGDLALPWYAGGPERAYACEEKTNYTTVTLDPGDYYMTIKGINDGTSCEGPYQVQLTDLGSPTGGYMMCSDNESTEVNTSALETTLTTGSYYIVLKGKNAGSQGKYVLNVRDTDVVTTPQIACASSTSSTIATTTITATPGQTYYAVVKGDTPADAGNYSVSFRDGMVGTSNMVGCDNDGGIGTASEMTLTLNNDTTYYALLKGTGATEDGDYRLTVGGAASTGSYFTPASYADTINALQSAGVHTATILTCGVGGCPEAEEQAMQLTADVAAGANTRAVYSVTDATGVATATVNAVSQILTADEVAATVLWNPSSNTDTNGSTLFASNITPQASSTDLCASESGMKHDNCAPGAQPTVNIELSELLSFGVPPGDLADGSYQFTLQIDETRDGVTNTIETRPLIVTPSTVSLGGSFGTGSYAQDTEGQGCNADPNLRPSWDELAFDADVVPDTQMDFYACTADSASDLDGCDSGSSGSSGYQRVLTLSAGSGSGTVCSVDSDCANGFCSAYSGTCIFMEGTSCAADVECPGAASGSCYAGPNAGTLGTTCAVVGRIGSPAYALGDHNLRQHLRTRIDLSSFGTGARAPSLYRWETRYFCRSLE